MSFEELGIFNAATGLPACILRDLGLGTKGIQFIGCDLNEAIFQRGVDIRLMLVTPPAEHSAESSFVIYEALDIQQL